VWTTTTAADEKASVDSETRVPFVVDVCRATFDHLQLLLTSLFDSVVVAVTDDVVHTDSCRPTPPPPNQFSECLITSTLSLLKLQVTAYLLTYL